MTFKIKNILLAGSAIVAIGAAPVLISPAYAADEFSVDADASGAFDGDELASQPFDWGAVTNGTGAAGEATNGRDLRVNASGAITVNDGDIIGENVVNANGITVNANGLTLTLNQDAAPDAAATVVLNGNVTRGANAAFSLVVNGVDDADSNDSLEIDVNGAIDLGTGALTIAADDDTAGNNVTFKISGNLTAATITLDDGLSDAKLVFDGTALQTVNGTIDGAAAGEGNIRVENSAGVLFVNNIGTTSNTVDSINVGKDGTATVSAEFRGNVATANGIIIGDNEAASTVDTVTITFNATGGNTAVTGTVDGNGTDTANVIIGGDSTVTANSAWGATNALSSVTLTGTASLDVNTSLAATTVTIGDGTTLIADGALNATTLTIGAGTSGILTANAAVTATTLNIAAGATFNANVSQTANASFTGDGTIVLANGADWTGTINNTSGADGAGNLTLNTAGTNTVSGAVGSSNTLNSITVNAAGTTAFGSTVNVDDIDFAAAGTLNFAGNVTTTNDINFANQAGTINFADNVNLTGSIDSTAGTNGTVNFAGTSTVSGTIGITSNAIAAINFNGGTGEVVTLGANVAATDVKIAGVGTVQANGNITAAVDFDADGILRLADGGDITGAIISSTLGEGSLILEGNADIDSFGTDGSELKVLTVQGVGSTVGLAGAFEAANTTNVDGAIINATGTFDADSGQVLNFDITGATAAGQITAGGAATIDANTVLNIDVATGQAIANGQSYTLIDGTGGAGVADLAAINDSSYLISFVQDTANDQDLVVTASVATKQSAATTVNNAAVGAVLDGVGTSANTQLFAIQKSISGVSTQKQVNDLLESTLPTIDAGSYVASMNVTNQSMDVISTRLASIRDDRAGTGMYAGNGMFGTKVWGQGFGNSITQDAREGIDGYEAGSIGLAVGIDTADKLEGMTIGLAGAYATTSIDSDNENKTKTEIGSWQIAAYANYYLSKTMFLDVMAGYALNDIESNRYNVGGISGLTANGDTVGSQYYVRAELGKGYEVDAWNDATLTPSMLVNYIHVNQDEYTEEGAGGASLFIQPDQLDVFELGANLELSWKKRLTSGGIFQPSVHMGYRFDAMGDDVAAQSRFIGGGSAFKTEGANPAQNTFNIGLGATIYNTDNWAFTGGYDFEYKTGYSSHSGVMKATYKY